MAKTIVITEADRAKLSQVLDVSHSFGDDKMGQCLRELNTDLENAQIVESNAVPQDVVTMNSRVVIRDLDSKEEEEWTPVPSLDDLLPAGIPRLNQSTGGQTSQAQQYVLGTPGSAAGEMIPAYRDSAGKNLVAQYPAGTVVTLLNDGPAMLRVMTPDNQALYVYKGMLSKR